jgi:hypothetical protein
MADFDKFSVLDPQKLQRETHSTDNNVVIDQWTAIDDNLFRDRFNAEHADALDNWSALDPALELNQIVAALD